MSPCSVTRPQWVKRLDGHETWTNVSRAEIILVKYEIDVYCECYEYSMFGSCFQMQISAASIIAADSAAKQEEAAALAGTWDGEKRVISKLVAT